MVPDRQKVRTDGMDGGRTEDAKTVSLGLRRGIINDKEHNKGSKIYPQNLVIIMPSIPLQSSH